MSIQNQDKKQPDFAKQLCFYMEQLQCTARELAEVSGLSTSVINRYRSGQRVPAPGSEPFGKLCKGICNMAEQKNIAKFSEQEIAASLQKSLQEKNLDCDQLAEHFNALISVLEINLNELARALNYDPSYLSRIRSKTRRPAHPEEFIQKTAGYVARHCRRSGERAAVANLTGCALEETADESRCRNVIADWLGSEQVSHTDSVKDFLQKLDEFDLNAYIQSIHFDELKVPTVPFVLPTSRFYYGLEQMRKAELDFLKEVVLSKSMEPVTMYSDMPMEDLAEDLDFSKKWMYGMALMLKKGLHLNMIHNVDRPLQEMMLGLESFIPMYMTGQILPYYLKGTQSQTFCHLLRVSGTTALTGESLSGFHGEGRYHLTNNPEEVGYQQKKAGFLLKKAKPLMEIYRKDSQNVFQAFLLSEVHAEGKRHSVLSAPPLYTATKEFLEKILSRNGLSANKIKEIQSCAAQKREQILQVLERNLVTDEIPDLSREEFEEYSMALPLSEIFCEKDIFL